MSRQPVFRDGRLHVLAEMCETCVFRPGNLMYLQPGRLRGMVDQAVARESCIPCHKTLGREPAICAGFAERHQTQPMQVAERLGLIETVTLTTKGPA